MADNPFPVILTFNSFNVLIVGGGKVAFRKAKVLIKSCDKLVIISPVFINEFQKIDNLNKIEWIQRPFKESDIIDFKELSLCIAATDDINLNSQITTLCKQKGILINTVTNPKEGTCNFPAFFDENDLLVSVSTNGLSPTISRGLRDDLFVYCQSHYSDKLKEIKKIRQNINTLLSGRQKEEFWNEILKLLRSEKETNSFKIKVDELIQNIDNE